jgi:primosomal protein N'
MAPRLSALADTLALLVRAARVVGIHGRIIVQTRAIDHPLIQAIQKADAPHIQEAIMVLLRSEAGRRRSMALPPVAYCSLVEGLVDEPPQALGIQIATLGNVKKKQDEASNIYLVKSERRNDLVTYLVQLRQTVSEKIRVRIDPSRM